MPASSSTLRRLLLRLSDADRSAVSRTGRLHAAASGVWAGYAADRALLLVTVAWVGVRAYVRETALLARPEALYEPGTWLSALFQPAMPSALAWYGCAAVVLASVVACWFRPQLVVARVVLALGVLLLIAPEFAFGKVDHMNHVFLVGHVLAVLLPVQRPDLAAALAGRPGAEPALLAQARAFDWYRAGLLFPYTLAGFWKLVDMTVRAVLKPGMTYLHPDALLLTSVTTYRSHDLPLDVPQALAHVNEAFVPGYVLLAFVFLFAALAGFRRPLLGLMLPAILAFHVSNVWTLYVIFLSTCLVVLALLLPYDRLLPALRRQFMTVERRCIFSGRGRAATYERHYANGDLDTFEGFEAYRARWTDTSWLLGGPLHHPLVAVVARWAVERRLYPTVPERTQAVPPADPS